MVTSATVQKRTNRAKIAARKKEVATKAAVATDITAVTAAVAVADTVTKSVKSPFLALKKIKPLLNPSKGFIFVQK